MRTRYLLLFFLSFSVGYAQTATLAYGPSYQNLNIVSPGQVTTFVVSGLAIPPGGFAEAPGIPLPLQLGGISAKVYQLGGTTTAVPILRVTSSSTCDDRYPQVSCASAEQITVQIPYELFYNNPGSSGAPIFTTLVFSDQGGDTASLRIQLQEDTIHIINSCDILGYHSAYVGCNSVINTPSGYNPGAILKVDDVVIAYAWGLGPTEPAVASGSAPAQPVSVRGPIEVAYDFHPNAQPIKPDISSFGIQPTHIFPAPLFAGLVPGFVGLYQINIQIPSVPAGTPACGGSIAGNPLHLVLTNLTITVIGTTSTDGFAVCVQP